MSLCRKRIDLCQTLLINAKPMHYTDRTPHLGFRSQIVPIGMLCHWLVPGDFILVIPCRPESLLHDSVYELHRNALSMEQLQYGWQKVWESWPFGSFPGNWDTPRELLLWKKVTWFSFSCEIWPITVTLEYSHLPCDNVCHYPERKCKVFHLPSCS